MIKTIAKVLRKAKSHKNGLRYKVGSVRFRNDGLPYRLDAWNLAKDCGIELGNGGGQWFAELPKTFVGIRIGTTRVEFGAVTEDKAFVAALLGTRKGRKVLAKSVQF